MKTRFILFRRAGTYYCEDTVTRKQTSLRTKKESEAVTMLNARNESFRQPQLNIQIARACLIACDPAMSIRPWQAADEHPRQAPYPNPVEGLWDQTQDVTCNRHFADLDHLEAALT